MISLNELKKMCKEYDRVNGQYPESFYEGLAVFRFIVEQMQLTFLEKQCDNITMDEWVAND